MTKRAAEPGLFTPAQELEQVLPAELAQHFIDHRKILKKPMTAFAAQLLAKKLRTFADPIAAIEKAIIKGWLDVYAETDNRPAAQSAPSVLERRKKELAERVSREHGIGREGSEHNGDAGGLFQLQDHRRIH